MLKLAAPVALALLLATPEGPLTAHLSRVREVTPPPGAARAYLTLDDEIFAYAQPGLGDLRLLNGEQQVPYAVRAERSGGGSAVERPVKILNLGETAGHIEFDVDAGDDSAPLTPYDHLTLQLDAHDFVAKATVSGGDSPAAATKLGSSTLFDFSAEHLGSNAALTFPVTSYRYLHVSLSPGLQPPQVKAASVTRLEEEKTAWRNAGSCAAIAAPADAPPHASAFRCQWPERTPVDRVLFTVDARRVNFRRSAQATCEGMRGTLGEGALSRVRLMRGGNEAVSESLTLEFPSTYHCKGEINVYVLNGDDVPLEGLTAQLQSVEHRLYFGPNGAASLRLYYGDPKMLPPDYDFARFFSWGAKEPAQAAQLGPGGPNPAFTPRPDDRPWSEQHPFVLWGAMLAAVLTLGALAVRGMRQQPPAQ